MTPLALLERDAIEVATPPLRLALPPATDRGDAFDAVVLGSAYGLTPDDWQGLILDAMLRRRADGKFSAGRVGVSVPRQNGKNGALEIRELYGLAVLGERILHTAHEVKTARKAFLRLAGFFENARDYPELAALVKEIRRTNGQEAIVLTNGGSIEFVARTKGSGRGFTVDVLVFDEAQELDDDALAALLPTISAAPLGNPQQIYTGTPPGPGMAGDVFTRVRNAGLEASDPRLAWLEWAAEVGDDFDDPAVWHRANPALGLRLDAETVLGERTAFDEITFGRERLGMWDETVSASVISPETWELCLDATSDPSTNLVLAIDIAPDSSGASIGVAGLRDDELWHVEIADARPGVAWLADRVVKIAKAHGIRSVIVDGASPAVAYIETFRRARLDVVVTGARDMAAACVEFYHAAHEGRLRHLGDARTDHALLNARKRKLGDAWAWNRQTSASDITPVVALTLALWGAQSTRVKRKKRSSTPRKVVVWD